MHPRAVHHIAIICSDYERSKFFYTEFLGLTIMHKIYREERRSYKLELALNGQFIIELFSFPDPPDRPSHPETCGLRHLAFAVDNITEAGIALQNKGVSVEPVRLDDYTQKRFYFFSNPDGLPIELYEN